MPPAPVNASALPPLLFVINPQQIAIAPNNTPTKGMKESPAKTNGNAPSFRRSLLAADACDDICLATRVALEFSEVFLPRKAISDLTRATTSMNKVKPALTVSKGF